MKDVTCVVYAGAANWVSLGENWPLRLGDDESSPVASSVLPDISWRMNKSETYCSLLNKNMRFKGEQAPSGGNPQPTIRIKV